jgi:capsular exopolysaccharide synthesis family protein
MARREPAEATPDVPTITGELQLQDCLQIARRQRVLGSAIVLGTLALAILYAFTATPVFEARAKLLIEPEIPRVVTFSDVIAHEGPRPEYYETQYQVLRSRSLAMRTLDRLGLWTDAELGGSSKATKPVATASTTGSSSRAAVSEASAARGDQPERDAESQIIDRFLARLVVSPQPTSRIVEIAWRSADATRAAIVVNALADTYILQNLEQRSSSSNDASGWLQQRLDEQRERVKASELALQRYREKNNVLTLPQGDDIDIQKLSELSGALTRARTDRIRKEALYQQLRSIQEQRIGLDAVADVLANPYVQQLKSELADLERQQAQAAERLGSEHPTMLTLQAGIRAAQSKLERELAKMVDSAHNEVIAAEAQEQALDQAVRAQKGEALKDSRKAIELDVLQRNLATDRNLLEVLLQRVKETDLSRELKASNIRVLDRAEVPMSPIWPRKGLVLALGLFVGCLMSVTGMFGVEYFDDRVRSAADVRTRLGLQPLGLVPKLLPADVGSPGQLLTDGTATPLGESFRFVRANTLSTSDAHGSRQFVVTSAGAGEGKTVVASNLAAALSQAGERVLLVDADMRSPTIHRLFALPKAPGLADVLSGRAQLEEVVHSSGIPDLWIMAAGSSTPRPADLLASPQFRRMSKTLGESFDWIVVDSPPSSVVVDACLIAQAGSSVLFVLGADRTSRRAAQAALEQLAVAGVHVAGVVLNRADSVTPAYPYGSANPTHVDG